MTDQPNEISVLESSDYQNLARFLSGFPSDQLTEEQWLSRLHYWWEDNPAFTNDWVRGFKLVAAGEIVGFVGSFPSLVKIGENVVAVFNGTTWRVSEGFRNESIDLWSYNRKISKNFISFNTTPTEQVAKLIVKYHYQLYPWGDTRQYYYVLSPSRFIKAKMKGLPGIVTSLGALILQYAQQIKCRLKNSGLKSEICDKPDASFDQLWDNNKNRYDFTNVRNSQTVAWYAQGKMLVKIMSKNNLAGYAIFYKSTQVHTGLKELVLADLFWDKGTHPRDVLSSLIRDVGQAAYQSGFSVMKFPCFSRTLSTEFASLRLYSKESKPTGYVRMPGGQLPIENYPKAYLVLLQGDWGSFGTSEP